MKLIYAEFVMERNQDYLGFKMRGRKFAEASTPFVAAHDMFEHFPTDRGSLECELRALGAGMFLRRDFNEHMTYIGDDVALTLNTYGNGATLRNPPRMKMGKHPLEWMTTRQVWKLVDLRHRKQMRKIIGWMRLGYTLAQQRFAGCPDVQNVYYRTYMKLQVYKRALRQGDVLKIIVDPSTGQMDTEVVYGWLSRVSQKMSMEIAKRKVLLAKRPVELVFFTEEGFA